MSIFTLGERTNENPILDLFLYQMSGKLNTARRMQPYFRRFTSLVPSYPTEIIVEMGITRKREEKI